MRKGFRTIVLCFISVLLILMVAPKEEWLSFNVLVAIGILVFGILFSHHEIRKYYRDQIGKAFIDGINYQRAAEQAQHKQVQK